MRDLKRKLGSILITFIIQLLTISYIYIIPIFLFHWVFNKGGYNKLVIGITMFYITKNNLVYLLEQEENALFIVKVIMTGLLLQIGIDYGTVNYVLPVIYLVAFAINYEFTLTTIKLTYEASVKMLEEINEENDFIEIIIPKDFSYEELEKNKQ